MKERIQLNDNLSLRKENENIFLSANILFVILSKLKNVFSIVFDIMWMSSI